MLKQPIYLIPNDAGTVDLQDIFYGKYGRTYFYGKAIKFKKSRQSKTFLNKN